MPEYRYSQLSQPKSIRLLRLLPSEERDPKNLRCELFEYPLQNSDKLSYLYEALSSTWGSEDKPKSIIIDNQSLNVTENLYSALLHLQDHSFSRILLIDAVCINQTDTKEKEYQIPLMAEIYTKARSVVIWLGEAQHNSDQTLEAIRLAGEKSTSPSSTELSQQAILKLFQRQWFRRIWVREQTSKLLVDRSN
jgi:hypothetical protein